MDLAIVQSHGQFLFRWLHVFFGIIWIGLLYYFNFVQTPFFAETDANTKSGAIQKLVPRALWWFRWGAMFTFLTGLILFAIGLVTGAGGAAATLASQWGAIILPGAIFGTAMAANVWMVIWPKQRIVIASAQAVAAGGKADPKAADAGARSSVASRTNTLFSIPLLFCMLGTTHLTFARPIGENSNFMAFWVIYSILFVVIEWNALKGKLVGPLKTVNGVITAGMLYTVVLYAMFELFLARA